jgi:hypothetical protein
VSVLSPLVPDAGCCKQVLWRCDLPRDSAAEHLVAALRDPTIMADDAFTETPQSVAGLLDILEHRQSGHHVVVVRRTGRLQIRLDGLTPPPARLPAARAVYEIVARACRSAFAAPTLAVPTGAFTPPQPEDGGASAR